MRVPWASEEQPTISRAKTGREEENWVPVILCLLTMAFISLLLLLHFGIFVDSQYHSGQQPFLFAPLSRNPSSHWNGETCGGRDTLSHTVGVIISPATQTVVGPDTGSAPASPNTWKVQVPSTPLANTKFIILHFTEVSLPGSNRIEVDLGYETDVFHASDGTNFWTRPINIYRLAGQPIEVRYITQGATTGNARVEHIGVGQRHEPTPEYASVGHSSLTNCDPFFTTPKYEEPRYDNFWYCCNQPGCVDKNTNIPGNWQNAACVAEADPSDVRARVARSVGMVLGPEPNEGVISTCSVTLIDEDEIITAGHCFDPYADALASSVTFDYQTDCNGNRVPSYNARFVKIKSFLTDECRYDGIGDFCRLRLATRITDVPPLQLRPDLPGLEEEVFGVHQPNGAVKKLSIPYPGFARVIARNDRLISVGGEFHVSGGTSGSGLFDKAGRVLGVLSSGNPCGGAALKWFPSSTILNLIARVPPNPITRDVMIVFDRSGSMSELDATGRTKIEVARDAVSLFVQLVRSGVGNRLGLVSFSDSASSPVDFPRTALDGTAKRNLIGNTPFAGGIVGRLTPQGSTSIGDGLDKARVQLPKDGNNPRTIFLMTDGMENKKPWIKDVEESLEDINIHIVGFGKEGNLNRPLLTKLAADHDGKYATASTGVTLQKFFSDAFGNIFEKGILLDPEFDIASSQQSSPPLNFSVCSEDAITVALGWDNINGALRVNLTTPNGVTIGSGSPNVESSTGRSWTYLRVPLPYNGEKQGTWNATVFRPPVRTSLFARQVSALPLHYFINIIPTGGPSLRRIRDRTPYYTGDTINPLVFFEFPGNELPEDTDLQLTLTSPNASIGAILSKTGLKEPVSVQGDVFPARQATIRGIANLPLSTRQDTIELTNGPAGVPDALEESPIFGMPLVGNLTVEGEYQFHVKARTGGACQYNRELIWSVFVDVGVNASHTNISTTFNGTNAQGESTGVAVVTPRDRYDNDLGPGKGDDVVISGSPGTTVTGPVIDNGNGSYTVPIAWKPSSGSAPGVVITQPGRDAQVVQQRGV